MRYALPAAVLMLAAFGCDKSEPAAAVTVPPTSEDLKALGKANEWAVSDASKKFSGATFSAPLTIQGTAAEQAKNIFRVSAKLVGEEKSDVWLEFVFPWEEGRNWQDVKQGQRLQMTGKIDAIAKYQSGIVAVTLRDGRRG